MKFYPKGWLRRLRRLKASLRRHILWPWALFVGCWCLIDGAFTYLHGLLPTKLTPASPNTTPICWTRVDFHLFLLHIQRLFWNLVNVRSTISYFRVLSLTSSFNMVVLWLEQKILGRWTTKSLDIEWWKLMKTEKFQSVSIIRERIDKRNNLQWKSVITLTLKEIKTSLKIRTKMR